MGDRTEQPEKGMASTRKVSLPGSVPEVADKDRSHMLPQVKQYNEVKRG